MNIGILVILDRDVKRKFAEIQEMGFQSCQLASWDEKNLSEEMAACIRAAAKEYGIRITAFWCGWPGPKVWDFYNGQLTLGLVPKAYRFQRLKVLEKGSDFAKSIGVTDLVTHAGFLPENPCDENYPELIAALQYLTKICENNGQRFLFETGQETPVTLRRTIEDIGGENVGINLDPANLLMYGKANPIDALDVFGEYVWGVHGKDGEYPTNGRELGLEKPLGQGRVNYPGFIKKLKEIHYEGDITIEREITGEEQRRDILTAKKMLEELL